jgi:hypothetical protein
MKYAYVEDGVVKESNRVLPINWKNVSNFNLLDEITLKSYGWFPYRFEPTIIPPNCISNGSSFEITDDEVVEIQLYREKSQSEIDSELNSLWYSIRYRRNIELKECDWTQIADSPLSEELKDEWKTYRQELRDITLQTDPYNIIWPTIPGTPNV